MHCILTTLHTRAVECHSFNVFPFAVVQAGYPPEVCSNLARHQDCQDFNSEFLQIQFKKKKKLQSELFTSYKEKEVGGTAKFSCHIKRPCKQWWPQRGCFLVYFRPLIEYFLIKRRAKKGKELLTVFGKQ